MAQSIRFDLPTFLRFGLLQKTWAQVLLLQLFVLQFCSAQITRLPQQVERKGTVKARVSLLKNIKSQPSTDAQRPGKVLRIRDIAKVYSSDLLLRSAIEELDIESWPKPGQVTTVTKSHVKLRLQLEGYEELQFPVVGWDEVKISAQGEKKVESQQVTNQSFREKLAAAIRAQVTTELGLSRDDMVIVNVDEKIRFTDQSLLDTFDGSVEIISDGNLLIGTRNVEFLLVDQSRFLKGMASASIVVGKNVNVAARPIKRGEVFSTANLRRKKFYFKNQSIRNVTGVEVYGQFASRDIRAGAQVQSNDLLSSEEKRSEFVVRKGSVVTALARRGNVEVKMANAICTEQGRIGDTISVQNSRSKQTFTARVISPDQVVLN